MLYIENLLFGTEAKENKNEGPRLDSKREDEQPERWVVKHFLLFQSRFIIIMNFRSNSTKEMAHFIERLNVIKYRLQSTP